MAARDTSLRISRHIPSALKMDKECAIEGPVGSWLAPPTTRKNDSRLSKPIVVVKI